MRWWLALVPLLAGCDFLWRLQHLDPPDAQPPIIDSEFSPIDAAPCAGTLVGYAGRKNGVPDGLLQICITDPPPKDDYELPYGFDTAANTCDQLIDQGDMGLPLCVITARTITISQAVDIKGARSLVLAATDSVMLSGNLNIGARAAGDKGPGSNYKNCSGNPGGDAVATGGGGGGAGGSFASNGGKGGDAINGGGAGGETNMPTLTIDRVRGGCGGGDGGRGIPHGTSANDGAGGASGGAVYIAAGTRIDLAANINASGGGGHGGDAVPTAMPNNGGGGGGGSGGMIALDAPMITLGGSAILVANGGAGGSGGGSDGTANPGEDPSAVNYQTCAAGGATVIGGSPGGAGACVSGNAKPGGATSKTGGGGGGGRGYIVLYTRGAPPPVAASPTPYINP